MQEGKKEGTMNVRRKERRCNECKKERKNEQCFSKLFMLSVLHSKVFVRLTLFCIFYIVVFTWTNSCSEQDILLESLREKRVSYGVYR